MKYLLDTNVFNYIFDHPDSLNYFLKIKDAEYFSVDIVFEKEFRGISPKKYDKHCNLIEQPSFNNLVKGEELKEIAKKLNVKIVPRYANFMLNHTKIDGSHYFLPSSGKQYEMVKAITSLHPVAREKHPFMQEYDAMIAASAIRNQCILITEDKDLAKVVRKYYPDNIILLNEFLVANIT